MKNIKFLAVGVFFGLLMYKSEAASWFRIYEMFTFRSLHMYGLMGSALLTGILLVQLIKRRNMKDMYQQDILILDKERSVTRYLVGGVLFGLGWALAGACPGPMFVLSGAGSLPMVLVLFSAVAGTWVYGLVKDRLPH